MEQIVDLNKKKDLPPSELRNQVTRACNTIPSGSLHKPATEYQAAIPNILVPAWDLRGGRRQDPVGQMATWEISLLIAESALGITKHLVESGSSNTAVLLGSTLFNLGNYWFEIYRSTEENGLAMPTLSMANYSILMDCGYKVQKQVAETSGDRQTLGAIEEALKRYKEDFQNRLRGYWSRNDAQFKDTYHSLP